jgi:hypothetical protein
MKLPGILSEELESYSGLVKVIATYLTAGVANPGGSLFISDFVKDIAYIHSYINVFALSLGTLSKFISAQRP